eukprot:4095415-Prymnesium_polylepis.1
MPSVLAPLSSKASARRVAARGFERGTRQKGGLERARGAQTERRARVHVCVHVRVRACTRSRSGVAAQSASSIAGTSETGSTWNRSLTLCASAQSSESPRKAKLICAPGRGAPS